MKIVLPKPFTFEAGKRAVLLLHGFTSHSGDVRLIGRFLESHGYTSHAPHYRGHAEPPENILSYSPDDWFQDVLDGYNHLKDLGYEEIAVCGLSLGGVFSLKLGYTVPIKGIIPMCAPMFFRNEESRVQGLYAAARDYKRLYESKSQEEIDKEMEEFKKLPLDTLKDTQALINDVREHIDLIYAPTFVVQGRLDDVIRTDSADVIYNEIESDFKEVKYYEKSGHVITHGKEKDQLHEDILDFLNRLDWKE